MNKQNIFNELKAFVAGVGVWVLTLLCLTLLSAVIFGVTPGKIAILSATIGLAAGVTVAYLVNDRKIPKLTLSILIAVGVIFYGLTSLITRSVVYGSGMEPFYKDGEGIWVDRFTTEFNKPKRGEVVLAKDPSGGSDSIRRVIGLPKEEIKLLGSMVIVNKDNVLIEPYVKTEEKCAIGTSFISPYTYVYKLEGHQYLVLPDNRGGSPQINVVSEEAIVGRVLTQRGHPTLAKLSSSGLREYSSPDLKVNFQYSSGCLVEDTGKITVKESKSGNILLDMTLFGQNAKRLTTEEWIKDNYKLVESVYCKPEENCRVKSEDRLFQITDRFNVGNLQYVNGSFKDSKYLGNDLDIGYGLFVAAGDRVYLISSGDKSILELLRFEE